MMRNLGILAAALFLSQAAAAESVKLGDRIYVNVNVRDNNIIRAYATAQRSAAPDAAMRFAVRAVAVKAKDLGFPKFAVTKLSDCGTMTVNGISAIQTCRILAQLLPDNGKVTAEEESETRYFIVDEVLASELPKPF